MNERLMLEGERYLGHFKATRNSRDVWRGTHGGEYEKTSSWYKGAGLVIDKTNNNKYFFVFQTPSFEDPCPTLQESLVDYGQHDRRFRELRGLPLSQVVDGMYPKIIDLSLESLALLVERLHDPLPEVRIPLLSEQELIEKGLLVSKKEQLHLPLKSNSKVYGGFPGPAYF